MTGEAWDVIVIGGGPAGYAAAIRARQKGLRVLLVERGELGGTCLNRGCIPSKALIHCAKVWRTVKAAGSFGVVVENPHFDWDGMQQWAMRVVQTLRRGLQSLLRHHGVTVKKGEATILSPTTVHIRQSEGEETVSAAALVLAMGSSPISLPRAKNAPVVTEEEALFLPRLPSSVIVVGGGASGVELAWLFNALGAKVTLVEMLPRLLPTMDEEVAKGLQHALENQGVTIRTDTRVCQVANKDGKALVITESGERWEAETVVCAVGRKANSNGLAELGIAMHPNDAVVVNEWQQTSIPSVFAAGDLVHGSWTAHGSIAEAEKAIEGVVALLSGKPLPSRMEEVSIPTCVYTEPQVLSVGLTETQAREKGLDVLTARFPWRANGAALATGETEGFVKVVADARTKQVLGVHILGADAVNLSGEASLIVARKLTLEQAATVVRQHPSLSEGIGEALWALLGLPLHFAKRPERGGR